MSENTALEESIRGEADKILQSINDREGAEIRRLDDAYVSDVEKFRRAKEAEIAEQTGQAVARISSRAMLDRRKLKLGYIETFINSVVDEAVAAMKCDVRYRRFIADAIVEIMDQVQGKAELFLGPDDQALAKDITDALEPGRRADVSIKVDDSMKWGGCIICDQQGRVFNSSMERIYFRKSSSIRQEVASILKQRGLIV